MALRYDVTLTGTGNTVPLVLDQRVAPFEAQLVATLVGTAAGTITPQYTVDNPFGTAFNNGTGATWRNVGTAGTVSNAWTVNYPVTAVRLNGTLSAGTVSFQVIQSGPTP